MRDLIFDFFGTLVDYTPGPFALGADAYRASHRVLQNAGFPIAYETLVEVFTRESERLEAEAARTHVEFHLHDLGRAFFAACYGCQPDGALLDLFIETFIAEWNRGTSYYEQIQPFLERLAGRYRLSIISNTHYPSVVWRNLEAMGVEAYFNQVVTSAEFGIRKPDPRIFQHALERLGISASGATYVGDNIDDDYRGARALGMQAILVDPRLRHVGLVEDRLDQLFDLERLLTQSVER